MLTFRTEKLTDRVTRIFAFSSELMYLVEGDQRAALLDTGSGIGSLRGCVAALTDKPVIVLLTHGHVDHAMGAAEFDEVYMSRLDDYIFVEHGTDAFRRKGLALVESGVSVTDADIIPTADVHTFRDMKGGDSFDLGGVSIDIFDCHGHTKGSVAMLIREERSLLLGDACNYFTFMYDHYSTTIAEYARSLDALCAQVDGKFDRVYLSHGGGDAPAKILAGVRGVCDDIFSGNVDDVPFTFFDGSGGSIAKAMNPTMGRVDGGVGNIVYNKARVR